MNKKTSAHYQREYRKRLREQGLIKKEVWILPENTRRLSLAEKELRHPLAATSSGSQLSNFDHITRGDNMSDNINNWSTNSLFGALQKSDALANDRASIEMIDGVDQAIHIVMHDYGDLPMFLTVSGEQIIVESVLWSAEEVKDKQAFNEAALKTHKYFPLSTISLDVMSDGSEYYHMFGALSASSLIHNVIFEIETLASNVIQATSAYGEFLDTSLETQ